MLLLIAFIGGGITYVVLSRNLKMLDLRLYTESLFHATSALTNTGFQVASIVDYPDLVKVLFVT